jgi:predicted DNA-binding protein
MVHISNLLIFKEKFMKKKSHQKHIRLSDPLFARLTETAKKADMSVNQLITEAIKFYLHELANDPLFHLQPRGGEVSTLSKTEKAQLLIILQTFNLMQKLSRPEAVKEAAQWAAEMASKLEDM